jgi:hypothetical protein
VVTQQADVQGSPGLAEPKPGQGGPPRPRAQRERGGVASKRGAQAERIGQHCTGYLAQRATVDHVHQVAGRDGEYREPHHQADPGQRRHDDLLRHHSIVN